jgi:UDP-N-acetylglucosamine 1-carboxyvinyltransferase
MLEILEFLGCKIKKEGDTLIINSAYVNKHKIPPHLAGSLRASIFLMGALLSRFKKAKVSYPGGCEIGARPIDLHLKGLKSLNVKISEKHGAISCDAKEYRSDIVYLDFPSVGATENLMMAAVLNPGITKIYNAAKEPEIADLANFINSMGGKIKGAGGSIITIEGVSSLEGTEYTALSDRIIAGTYLIAAATCGGDVLLNNVNHQHFYSLITKLKNSGCKFTLENDKIRLVSDKRLKTFGNIQTQPYPGFATDLQAQTMVLQAVSKGNCIITENLFETRFKQVAELNKMGAKIVVCDRMAVVSGVEKLYGAEVTCSDLRAGAALTIAGLAANGTTIVNGVSHIDRGYEKLDKVFAGLGADIKKLTGNN